MYLFFSLGQNALFAATVPILAWRLRENLTRLNDVSATVTGLGTTYDVTSGDECISFTGDTVGHPTTDG
jgi:hypothetical protein